MIKWLPSCLLPLNEKQNAARKKPRGRLRYSEVFLPLADHTIVVHQVVQPGICPSLKQNHPDFRSCHRHFRLSVEDVNPTILLALSAATPNMD